MIDALDVRTLFFVMTATALLAAVATTTLWFSHRKEAALPAWAIGAILSALGHLAIAMRGAIPLFVSIVVANICVAIGHTLFYAGARRFSGSKPLSPWVLVGVTLFIGSSFHYFSAVQESTAIRIAIAFSFLGALSLITGWHFWRHADAIRGQVGRVIAASFGVVGIVLLSRIALYSIETPDQNFFRPDRFHHLAFFLFIMFYASLMYSFPVLLMSKELTRREAAEAELRRNELALSRYANQMEHTAQTLEEAQRVANVGSWEYDPQTRELFWSAETFRIFRRDPALGPPSLKEFLAAIHPDDAPRLLSHMEAIARTAQPYDVELRHQRPDGSLACTVTRARPVMENGTLKRVFGSIHDVTAYKLAESRLLASEQQLRNILETSPIAVRILTLEDNTVSFANEAYARLLNLDLESLRGVNPLQAYAAPEEYEKHKAQVKLGRIVSNVLMELRVPQDATDGSEAPLRSVWVLTSYFPIRYQDRDSSIAWFFDVTELREAKEAAEAASIAKSAFLANMSHEIRTPMNAVLGLTHLAMRRAPDPRQREYLEKIERAGRHLMGVLNDVLDFSKIESGKLEVENVPFFLSAVLDTLRQMQEYRAVEKGLSFSVRVAADVPAKLRGDPLRIGQVLINFVSNAIKFTERGGVTIQVGAVSRDGATAWLRFSVSDTGVGIASESLSGLFEAFQQADASISRRFGGTGLGLAISRQIARLMGGRTGASSTPGVGSCFWLELPLGIEADQEAGECGSVAGSREILFDRLKGRRVLVAEDNLFNQQVAQELLGDVGIAVVLAQNGDEAISWLDRETFDAILMDMQMPVMDGLAATRAIRLRPDGKSIPIIAMTANVRHEDERACRAAGMDDFVTKPILPDSLYRMLLRWLDPQSPSEVGTDAASPPPVQTPEPPAATALLNIDALQGIAQGRPGRMEKLLTSYFASVERALPALDDACRQAQHASVKAIGHQLKSASRWVGAESIAALSLELEKLPAESIPQRAAEIRAEIADLLARLRQTCETAGYLPPKPGA